MLLDFFWRLACALVWSGLSDTMNGKDLERITYCDCESMIISVDYLEIQ